MKVLYREIEPTRRGVCWLDPRRIGDLLSRDTDRISAGGDGVASAVLAQGHLVASSIPCEDHVALAERAGIDLQEIDPFHREGVGGLRMWISADSVNVEFWRPDADEDHPDAEIDDDKTPPQIDTARLDAVIEHVRSHPAIQTAYPDGVPLCQISIITDDGRLPWLYDTAAGLRLDDESNSELTL